VRDYTRDTQPHTDCDTLETQFSSAVVGRRRHHLSHHNHPHQRMLSLVIALGVAGQRPSIRGPGLQEGCSPQKACDFVVGIHAQCISTDPWPPHPIPGAPGCKPIALLCTPEENCVLDSVNFQDNITTEGVERLVTLTNVVIQVSIHLPSPHHTQPSPHRITTAYCGTCPHLTRGLFFAHFIRTPSVTAIH
jgi:hypothetical protein